ncbi:lipoprotein insertase outer membrane protein LolB [Porticoccaceae bacterium LTM1]|nr:lipoprotein insertase outer membrane protein LolB [Porticoccaceae bacterium LTM1]
MKRLLSLSLLLALTACSHTPITNQPADIESWPSFVDQQSRLNHWQLQGKLGIRLPKNSPPGLAINWQQQEKQFQIRLSGFLGVGAAKIEGDSQQVSLMKGDEYYQATNSEQLTEQLLGMPISLDSLMYWVRGLPDPNMKVLFRAHHENGTLSSLLQNDWELSFQRYQTHGQWWLPGLIKGQRGDLKFTLSITDWQSAFVSANEDFSQ